MFFRTIELTRSMRILAFFLVVGGILLLGVSTPATWADEGDDDDEGDKSTIPFADTGLIFETNFTDRDTGIQISLDGEPWKEIAVSGPDGKLVQVKNRDNLKRFGLTELFFESNEPNYADLALADIVALFPPGEYKFTGKTVEGDRLDGKATLTHVLPCGPEVGVNVGGSTGVTISWAGVTTTIDPATETCGGDSPNIEGYQVVVEPVEDGGTFSVELPAESRNVTVPPQFLEPGTAYKFEVLAIEESGNQTITEATFSTP